MLLPASAAAAAVDGLDYIVPLAPIPPPLLLLLLLAKAETNCVLPITYAEHNPVEQELSL